MLNLLYHLLFLIFTLYVCVQSISYSIYEIKHEKNSFGGIAIIVFTIFSVIFSNIMVWQN